MSMRAELRNVRTFVAIAEAGGVARAATRLHLSQPAASRQIHALEAELGLMLFDRVGRSVRLTAEGEDLLPRCRRLLLDAEALNERAGELRKGEVGVLRVGATPQVIENLLSVFGAGYRSRHPRVEVHLLEDGGARLPLRLATGDVQLAVMPEGDRSFEHQPLYPMHLIAVVASGHRLARRRAIELSDLADQPLLVLNHDFASRAWFDAIIQVARMKPRSLIESAVPQTLLALARDGHGIALVPSPVTVPQTGVCAMPLVYRGASIGRWAVLAWDPRRGLARHALTFIHELTAHVQREYPGRALSRRAPPLPRP
jgi:LysR family cyn operon transcriptional activator